MSEIKVTIEEQGNGLPRVGDYVSGDGELYEVVSIDSITLLSETGSGRGDYVHATVRGATWGDVDDDDIFPARVRVEPLEVAS